MRIQVELTSTALRSASYDPELQELDLRFTNGSLHTYENVPEAVFNGLRDAPSPGSYYHANIKDKF